MTERYVILDNKYTILQCANVNRFYMSMVFNHVIFKIFLFSLESNLHESKEYATHTFHSLNKDFQLFSGCFLSAFMFTKVELFIVQVV